VSYLVRTARSAACFERFQNQETLTGRELCLPDLQIVTVRGTIAHLLSNSYQISCAVEAQRKAHSGCVMTVKNIVVELEVEYLQKAAKARGVSRAKLVRLLMKKVIAEQLVSDILGNTNLADA
jgi:hypothetical protein